MNLTRALKEKNRLIKKLTAVRNRISSSNVVLEDNKFPYDMQELQVEYEELTEILIDLKVVIQIANQPILEKIYAMSELKSAISMVEQIDTKEGKHEAGGYGSTELRTFKAQFSRQQLDNDVANIQKKIDGLQDEIDTFNFTTEVEYKQ